ncbi:hypothetical protein [Pseudomonas sp. CG7]|nr:hypothetical protein [Pseudomonas sp. CG7]
MNRQADLFSQRTSMTITYGAARSGIETVSCAWHQFGTGESLLIL